MSLTLTYDPQLSRVRASISGLVDVATYTLERSVDEIRWTTVRGGVFTPSAGSAIVDDYEFAADVANFYRLRGPALTDDYGRTVAAGSVGTATSGQTYTLIGTADDFSVSSGTARIATTTINQLYYAVADVGAANQTVHSVIGCPVVPTGGVITLRVVGRFLDAANYYEAIVLIDVGGEASLFVSKRVAGVGSIIGSSVVIGSHAAGNRWEILLEVSGSAVRSRAWNIDTDTDPGDWQQSQMDSDLTTGTLAGHGVRRDTGNTNGVQTITLDDLWSTPQTTVFTDDITPVLEAVWLKSVARPFLNRTVRVGEYSPFTRPSRAGTFAVVGRELPVGVTDVMGSKRLSVDVYAKDAAEARAIDLLLASGDILLVHTPATGPLSTLPGGYAIVGGVEHEVLPSYALNVRRITIPYTLVAAPGPDVVGVTSTWQTVINQFATWADLVAAFPTWAAVLDTVGSADDVVIE